MLLFRKTGKLCIVLLVGENPTSGIDKRSFAKCLTLIQKVNGCSETVNIIGPYFSGSQTSLRIALKKAVDQDKKHKFRLIGAANGINKEDFLEGFGDRVSYFATQVHTDQVIEAILYFLDKRDHSNCHEKEFPPIQEKVVLFTESNTAYGRSAAGEEKKASQPSIKERNVTVVKFPLHISRLRATYDKGRRMKEEKLGLLPADSLLPYLDDRPETQGDIIPAQDEVTSALTNDQVLSNILTTIAREKSRYVGIVATDSWDKVFLACYVRDHCPRVQLFFLGSDSVLSLREYSYYMKGAIVGSTYPLISENQDRTNLNGKGHKKFSFPNQAAQAYYNATLAQIGKFDQMVEYQAPRFGDCTSASRRRPPIWITMIGQNGETVPLQFFDNYKDKDSYIWPWKEESQKKVSDRASLTIPGPAIMTLIGVCLFGSWILICAFLNRSPWLFWWPTTSAGMAEQTLGQRGEKFAYRLVCLVALGIILIPLAFLGRIYLENLPSSKMENWVILVVRWLAGILVCLPLALLFPYLPALLKSGCFMGRHFAKIWFHFFQRNEKLLQWTNLFPLPLQPIFAHFLVGILLLGVPGCLLFLFWESIRFLISGLVFQTFNTFVQFLPSLNSWDALFFERAFSFSSGVSPLMPLIFMCLAFFLWVFFQLKGTLLFDRFSVKCPWPNFTLESKSGQEPVDFLNKIKLFDHVCSLNGELEGELKIFTRFLINHPFSFVILLAATGFLGFQLNDLCLPLVEGTGWGRLLLLGFVLAFFLILLNLLRFLFLWSKVKKLLHEISLIPMMGAFDHLPARVSSIFGGYLFTQRPRHSQLRVPVQQTRLLISETDQLLALSSSYLVWQPLYDWKTGERLIPEFKELKTKLENLVQIEEKYDETNDDFPETIRNLLSEISQRCLKILPWFWATHSVDEAFGTDPSTGTAATTSSKLPNFFDGWIKAAESLVATQTVIYLSQFFIQLRNLVWSLTICSSLLLFSATSYPFQPERLMLFLMIGVIGGVLGGVLYVLVQMNYDELASRITRTTPNRFTLDSGFIGSFFRYIVPTFSILAIQLSGTFRFLLEPILRAIK